MSRSDRDGQEPWEDHADVQELLAGLRRLGGDRQYIVQGLIAFLATVAPVTRPEAKTDEEQHEYLVELGVFTQEQLTQTKCELKRGSLQLHAIESWLSAAWDTKSFASAARFLHVSEDDLRGAVAERRVIAVEIGGELRFPSWQFNSRPVGDVLPHLAELIPAIEQRWGRRSMGRFFGTRQEDLVGEGRKTPAAWLEDGGDPQAVRDLIERGGTW